MRRLHSLNLLIVAVLSSTLTLFTGMPGVTGVSAQPATPAAAPSPLDERIRGWIENAIDPDTGRGAIRLPAVWIDDTGDLTVVFALREKDDLDAFRAAAEEDVFRILRAVYTESDSPVRTATVVGTYSVTETTYARELPMLRTVLSAQNAGKIDWENATPQDLFTAADVYRLYPPFGDEQGNPVAPISSPVPKVAGEDPVISSPINIGDRLIFLRCIGSGGPTVILEAGTATTARSGLRCRFMPRNSCASAATTARVWNGATNRITIRAPEPRWWQDLHAALQSGTGRAAVPARRPVPRRTLYPAFRRHVPS